MKGVAEPPPGAFASASCCANLYELPVTQLLLGSSYHPGGPALTRRLARAAAIGPGDRVLDVASGVGATALLLAREVGARVTGLDFSAQQVARASEAASSLGLTDAVRFVQGNAQELPFSDASFDFVVSECALCTFPNRPRALEEVRRVLRARGVLALSDVVLNAPVPAELDTVMGHVLCISGALSVPRALDELSVAGFRNVRHRDESRTLHQLIDQIELRLRRLGAEAERQGEALPTELRGAGSTLRAARDFVRSGGVGYATFTARR